jgi:hypothetical protein
MIQDVSYELRSRTVGFPRLLAIQPFGTYEYSNSMEVLESLKIFVENFIVYFLLFT